MNHQNYNHYNHYPAFGETQIEQVGGSHMVMSSGLRPLKKKYYNIDTRFSDDYETSHCNPQTSFTVSLPERITKVKSLKATNVEFPFSYFNVSNSLNNNTIVTTDNTGTKTVYSLANDFYTDNNDNPISTYFTSNPINSYLTYNSYNGYFSQIVFTPSGGVTSMTIEFSVDTAGNSDKYNWKNKIGWLLGYRKTTYVLTGASNIINSESMINLNGFPYLFLAVDDFATSTNGNTFVAPLYKGVVNKSILSRIVPPFTFRFGDRIFNASEKDGTLVSYKRNYTGVDLQKFRVELVNEMGQGIDFNGLDFSFCLEIEYD